MRESMDFKPLKENNQNTKRPINYRILKQVSTPLLYILSDGVFTPPEPVFNGVAAGLDSIFNETRNWNVLASTNIFPSEKRTDSYDALYPLNFPWFEIEKVVESFKNGFGQRDLSEPCCCNPRYWDGDLFPASESEVLGTILEQNIRVFSLEGSDYNTLEPASKRISYLYGGLHFLIGTGEDDETNVATVVSEIDDF
ncbi:unnamed protein product [Orchesella dallaii]|uniref:Uncharacterized protein n=1 Tax=Orchesella dallaii TaxID=48710 RepID=A0ABP1RK64_9HEXA